MCRGFGGHLDAPIYEGIHHENKQIKLTEASGLSLKKRIDTRRREETGVAKYQTFRPFD